MVLIRVVPSPNVPSPQIPAPRFLKNGGQGFAA
jgi:hypothetical protein